VKVVLKPVAENELADIWDWKAKERGIAHADRYVESLKSSIFALDKTYSKGRKTDSTSNLRYIVIRRRARGHGHLAEYTADDNQILVLHVFYTAQDWQGAIAREFR
jgi:plasmid stabilization system protein ParE